MTRPKTAAVHLHRSPSAAERRIALSRSYLLILAALVLLGGCGPLWQATVTAPDGNGVAVNATTLKDLDRFADQEQGVPLERVLWTAGHRAIEHITVTESDGSEQIFDWGAVAEDAWWRGNGALSIAGKDLRVSRIDVEAPALLDQVEAGIIDLAPTAAATLGIRAPAEATGRFLDTPPARHVVLLFLDGFGYVRYVESKEAGLIPTLASLGQPMIGLTVYPPCTNVASAALLTGAEPEVNGVDDRGIRQTDAETLFDVANAAGLGVVAVEGDALAFNLRNAETQLSGDRDANGSTDDNVLASAMAVLADGTPDLFYVHFHGIDDRGHTYGPGAPEEIATIQEVDAAVGQILAALAPDTLVLIFADHGMHAVQEEGRLGNHGQLIARDMFIPVFIVRK
jgi:hypothetical protein